MRSNQRGIFALGLIGSILVYVGFAAAAVIAIRGFDLSRQHIGRDEQKTADAPVMSICDSLPQPTGIFGAKKLEPKDCAVTLRDGLTAIGANVQLRQDFKKLDDERQACSDKVARLGRISAAQDAANKARKPIEDAKVAAIDAEEAQMIAALGLPDKGGTCEQKLARHEARIKRIAEQRVRDFPPTPGAAKSSDDVNIKGPK